MDLLRYSAFSAEPGGGNPAGVVLDATGLDEAGMLALAAEVGYSETAFLMPEGPAGRRVRIRYFSPWAEVPFCGHATIATAVAHAERHGVGTLELLTASGSVTVTTRATGELVTASLTSVEPRVADLTAADLSRLLEIAGLAPADLDPQLPPGLAFGGAWHPLLFLHDAGTLARLQYDFAALQALMAERDWPATTAFVHRAGPAEFVARNAFPPGGVVEDPATGAAAAALGGYLRTYRFLEVPAAFVVHQGAEVGRPSTLQVEVPEVGGIVVSGTAVRLPG